MLTRQGETARLLGRCADQILLTHTHTHRQKKPTCLYEAWGHNVSFFLEISRCFSNIWPIVRLSREVNTNRTCKGKALLVQRKIQWPAVVNVVWVLRVCKGRWILSSWTTVSASLRTHLRGSSWVIVKLLLLCTVPYGIETSVLTRRDESRLQCAKIVVFRSVERDVFVRIRRIMRLEKKSVRLL